MGRAAVGLAPIRHGSGVRFSALHSDCSVKLPLICGLNICELNVAPPYFRRTRADHLSHHGSFIAAALRSGPDPPEFPFSRPRSLDHQRLARGATIRRRLLRHPDQRPAVAGNLIHIPFEAHVNALPAPGERLRPAVGACVGAAKQRGVLSGGGTRHEEERRRRQRRQPGDVSHCLTSLRGWRPSTIRGWRPQQRHGRHDLR